MFQQLKFTTIREISRDSKKLITELEKTQAPIIVNINSEPKFALIALDQLDNLKAVKEEGYVDNLLKLADMAEELSTDKATDLSENHNKYLYDANE